MFLYELYEKGVYDYWYDNRQHVPVLDTVTIQDYHVGRLDILVNEYWGSYLNQDNYDSDFIDVFPFYQLLLDFNGIMDIDDVKVGMVIAIPDILVLSSYIELNDATKNDIVPGVNDIRHVANKSLFDSQQIIQSEKYGSIVHGAIPKLKIKQQSVRYDNKNGKIIF